VEQIVLAVDGPTPVHFLVSMEVMWILEEESKALRSRPKQSVSTAGYAVGGYLAIWRLLTEETSGVLEARLEPVPLKVILQTFSRAKQGETCVRR
jgi:hypothetical protein